MYLIVCCQGDLQAKWENNVTRQPDGYWAQRPSAKSCSQCMKSETPEMAPRRTDSKDTLSFFYCVCRYNFRVVERAGGYRRGAVFSNKTQNDNPSLAALSLRFSSLLEKCCISHVGLTGKMEPSIREDLL